MYFVCGIMCAAAEYVQVSVEAKFGVHYHCTVDPLTLGSITFREFKLKGRLYTLHVTSNAVTQ